MHGIFLPDSKFMLILGDVINVVWINILMLVTSLAVVTIGTSLITGIQVSTKMVQGNPSKITRRYFAAFKANLKNGISFTLINLALIFILVIDFQNLNRIPAVLQLIVFNIIVIASLALIFMDTALLGYLANFKDKFRASLRNALTVLLHYFGWMILGAIVMIYPVVIALGGAAGVMTLIYWFTFAGLGVFSLLEALIFHHVFTGITLKSSLGK